MIGYIANAIIGVLKFFSAEEDIRAYVIWGLGSFSRVGRPDNSVYRVDDDIASYCILSDKDSNLLLLGDSYARNPD